MRKWRVFALPAASSLIWGGWGFAVPFYFVQDLQLPFNSTHARTHSHVKAVIDNYIVLHFRFFQIGPKHAVI